MSSGCAFSELAAQHMGDAAPSEGAPEIAIVLLRRVAVSVWGRVLGACAKW